MQASAQSLHCGTHARPRLQSVACRPPVPLPHRSSSTTGHQATNCGPRARLRMSYAKGLAELVAARRLPEAAALLRGWLADARSPQAVAAAGLLEGAQQPPPLMQLCLHARFLNASESIINDRLPRALQPCARLGSTRRGGRCCAASRLQTVGCRSSRCTGCSRPPARYGVLDVILALSIGCRSVAWGGLLRCI
jgi:hypothetical protein